MIRFLPGATWLALAVFAACPGGAAAGSPSPLATPSSQAPSAGELGLRPLVLGRADIGAFPSAEAAAQAWRALAAAHPQAMAGKRQRIEPASATRYRAFVDGFPSRRAAEAFCRLLAARRWPCVASE